MSHFRVSEGSLAHPCRSQRVGLALRLIPGTRVMVVDRFIATESGRKRRGGKHRGTWGMKRGKKGEEQQRAFRVGRVQSGLKGAPP